MPVTKHLNRLDITDFTNGLWDERGSSTLLTPQNAFAVLEDYEPKQQGGLRAFPVGVDLPTTNIGNPTGQVCMGIYSRGNVVGSVATDNDQIVATINPATHKAHIYRWNLAEGATQWAEMYVDVAGASDDTFDFAEFAQFTPDADGKVHYVISLRGGSADGVYGLTYDTATATKYLDYRGPILASQARMMYANNGDIYYSDVGKLTLTGTPHLTVNPNQPGSFIGMMSERAPADLLIGLWASPWYEINGDISSASTPVRAMGDSHHQRTHFQHPAPAPGGGIVFIEPGGRIYRTDGLNFTSLSDAVARFDVDAGSASGAGPGQLAVLNDYLFAPGGKIMDFRTGAWFTSSFMPASVFHHSVQSGRVYVANSDAGLDFGYFRLYDSSDGSVTKASSGIFQTVPYHDPEGLMVRIREVQLQVQCYTSSGFVVKIIDSRGATVSTDTVTGITNRQQVTFRFPNVQDEYLSVRVEAAATNGTSEAPTIERMSIFFGPTNIIGNAAS